MPQGVQQLPTVQVVTGGGREIETVNIISGGTENAHRKVLSTSTADPSVKKVRNSGGQIAGLRTIRT
jgi:hypothetical protein